MNVVISIQNNDTSFLDQYKPVISSCFVFPLLWAVYGHLGHVYIKTSNILLGDFCMLVVLLVARTESIWERTLINNPKLVYILQAWPPRIVKLPGDLRNVNKWKWSILTVFLGISRSYFSPSTLKQKGTLYNLRQNKNDLNHSTVLDNVPDFSW